MGKKIIIKGADFSENGIAYTEQLFFDYYTKYGGGAQNATAANGGWAYGTPSAPYAGLANKTINFVRFKGKKTGTLNFYRCTDPTDSTTLHLVTSVEITAANQEVMHIFEPVTLNNEYFVIGEANSSQGLPGYDGSSGGGTIPWIGKVPSASLSTFSTKGLRIDVGYIDYQ